MSGTAPLTVCALFERSVAHETESLALKDGSITLTYRELDIRVDELAAELLARGARKGDFVIVHAERGLASVVAVLAILRAGAVFVPVSLQTPPARLAFIARDVGAALILADAPGMARLRASALDVSALDLQHAPPARPFERPIIDEHDLAYAIYTSGSTGESKGVLVDHGSIARRFHDWDAVFGLSGRALRFAQLASIGFDVFMGDLVKSIGSGGALILCPRETALDPQKLHALLTEEAIDYIDTVPALLLSLVEHLEEVGADLSHVEIINCGADRWTSEEYLRCRRITRARRVFNGYGVTECTVESTLFEGDQESLRQWETLPIGRALASDTLLVLDSRGEPVPCAEVGELCIGGPCVSRGYINRPGLDATRFFVRTDARGAAQRFYRTGDLARVDHRGVFEFLGRADLQVKINGQRIELSEIEHAIEKYPGVAKAVVCVQPSGATLTAFVRVAPGLSFDRKGCLRHLRILLPSYMVPSHLTVLDSFPTNLNGKVDRAALVRAAAEAEPPLRREPGKRPHQLHLARTLDDLLARLRLHAIDPMSVVAEFVRPGARVGVLVGGAISHGTATATSDLELLVHIEKRAALKQRRREILGQVVEYGPACADHWQASLLLDGIRIVLTFVTASPCTNAGSDWTVQAVAASSRS
jgi:amino acid adenylation domain-containing protein